MGRCGTRTTATPTGLPALWSYGPLPSCVCPPCTCGGLLRAVICFHPASSPPWTPHWLCDHHKRGDPETTRGDPELFTPEEVGGPGWALALAAEYLPLLAWNSFLTRPIPQGLRLWQDLRVQLLVHASLGLHSDSVLAMLPPWSPQPKDASSVAVALLLDTAGLLADDAAQAWRDHSVFGPTWADVVASLRTCAAQSRTAAVEALARACIAQGGSLGSPHCSRRAWLAWAISLYADA